MLLASKVVKQGLTPFSKTIYFCNDRSTRKISNLNKIISVLPIIPLSSNIAKTRIEIKNMCKKIGYYGV